jgi:glycosyltransferase involved in cell wall biosynthesis
MKILFTLHQSFDKELGAAGVTWRLGQEYSARGHQVEFLSFDDMPSYLKGKLIGIIFPVFIAISIVRRTLNNSVDVVVASSGDAWLWGKFFKNIFPGSPLLVTQSHGLEHMMHLQHLEDSRLGMLKLSWKYPLYNGSINLWKIAASLRASDVCFFLNKDDANYATSHLRVNPENVYVIPNGIPNYLLGIPFHNKFSNYSEKVSIVQIGSYIFRKGVDYSKVALSQILENHQNVELTFLGTCCEPANVLKDFEAHLHARIKVVPRYENREIFDLLKNHQIKLFPTLSEGFGLALLEAMACGLAPISSDVPGPRGIITNGHDGILVAARDSEAIKVALEKLISDKVYLLEMQKNAQKTAQNYDWSVIAEQRLDIYTSHLLVINELINSSS